MITRRHALRLPALATSALILGAAAPPPDHAPLQAVPVAATPISRMETPFWRQRHEEKLAEIKARRIDLIWLGDSITQDWDANGPGEWGNFAPVWQHYYGDRNALNLGFKGDTTAHLLWRMTNGELDGLHPKAVIILIGANNMGRVRWSAPQTVAGITAVVDEARRRLPGAKILLLAVLPSIRNKYVDRTTTAINQALEARYAHNEVPNVTYKDTAAIFMKDGQVDRTQFFDDHLTPPNPPLHPTAQAQSRLAAAIEPTIAAMMNDRPKPPR